MFRSKKQSVVVQNFLCSFKNQALYATAEQQKRLVKVLVFK